jgi:3-methyladenine DNA glycosylase AlkD
VIDYLLPFQELLKENTNQENATAMRAYMKERFVFYGIKSPKRRELQKLFLAEQGFPALFDKEVFSALWKADQREYQMFGLDLLRRQAKKAEEKDIKLIEKLIITKSWWDTVDGLASWVCGPYFLKFPEKTRPITQGWAESENMWLRRASILFQLGYKENTDRNILTDHIEKNLSSSEFFINKAIGWSLREYGKTDPEFVRDYVNQMQSRMHPLSVREATRNL